MFSYWPESVMASTLRGSSGSRLTRVVNSIAAQSLGNLFEILQGRKTKPELHHGFDSRIAVGMPIAGHPPRGSGRAQFEHPALTLGVDGEALCSFPYAAQRLGHAYPALGPVRALLVRVSLGPCPWLHRLRNRLPSFVRRLHSYYGRV